MFESLKKKFSTFKKKAAEQLPTEEHSETAWPAPAPGAPPKMVREGGKKIDDSSLDKILWDLEVELMESDVALEVVEEIRAGVRQALAGKRLERGRDLEEMVGESLRSAVYGVLAENEFDFDAFVSGSEKPVVIMFVGINGTGKTTVIAKVAKRLKDAGHSVVIAASDTFRAGAIEQISIHGDKLDVKVIKHKAGGDPAAVAYDAVEHARARRRDVVLVDTAGRMQTNANLMQEMKKIRRVAKPHLVIFVGDALAGNDAIEQAKTFDQDVGIDAVVLTKIDADARGGAALSIAHAVHKPIAFLSTGQGYDQLVKFESQWMIDRLFS